MKQWSFHTCVEQSEITVFHMFCWYSPYDVWCHDTLPHGAGAPSTSYCRKTNLVMRYLRKRICAFVTRMRFAISGGIPGVLGIRNGSHVGTHSEESSRGCGVMKKSHASPDIIFMVMTKCQSRSFLIDLLAIYSRSRSSLAWWKTCFSRKHCLL